MKEAGIHTNVTAPRQNSSLTTRIRNIVLVQKLVNPAGLIFFAACSCAIAWIVAAYGIVGGSLTAIVLVAIPAVIGIVIYPRFGIIVLLVAAYFIMWIYRLGIDFPLGTLMDAMEALLILGFFIQQKTRRDWSIFKSPIAVIILVWISYNILQFANPFAESRLAWVYTIRSVAIVMLMYFIFSYHIRSVAFIRLILKLWLALSLFAAIYALKQEYIGFFDFEWRSIDSPRYRSLLFINGQWRKFSIFSDPVAFSYNMVFSSILCITLLFGPVSRVKKVILFFLTCLFIHVMLFSGTRAAYVLIPAAIGLFTLMKFNRTVMLFAGITGILLATLVYVPTSSPGIRRFQTAFRPSDDASFNVRKMNQERIQPYIRSQPIGGGLGATGVWGARFAPSSFLARLPPDSGYVRVAAELGWVGLLLICTLFFVILKKGIDNYFTIKDPELKTYCLAMTLIVFAFAIGNYPQEALVQFPSNIYFYLFAALISVTLRIDKKKQGSLTNENRI